MLRFLCVFGLSISTLSLAYAQNDMAAAFGARESIQQISLSPDGQKIAFIAPMSQGLGYALFVTAINSEAVSSRILTLDGDPENLAWCRWASNIRLVCSAHMKAKTTDGIIGYSRLFALNADGTELKRLTPNATSRALSFNQNGGGVLDWLPNEENAVLMTRNFISESQIDTNIASRAEGLGVERVDTISLSRKTIERGKRDAVEYISDGHGAIRVMGIQPSSGNTGYSGNIIRYSFRAKDSREWQPLGTLDINSSEGFNPYAVDSGLNAVYGFREKDGRSALYRRALDGSENEELIFAHSQVDLDGLIYIGRNNRVVGVTYATEKRQTAFFDPELKKLAASLSKALPNLPLISFVDSSQDENRLLLWAGSDTDPGRYYIFDKKAKNLVEILIARPQLANIKMAEVKAVNYKAADGTMVPAYLTLPPGSTGKKIPAIVMPHGGPGSRDEWGFDWLSQYYANRGYAVLQPNFRGSAGYGDAWYQNNGFQSWRIAIGDVNDAGRWLVSEGIADPGKLAIVGWSYGGYAALQSAVLDPDLFKAIVAIAPVTDLNMLREESRNYTNFRLVDNFIGKGPHIKEGSPAQNAARIKAPVMLFHGEMDQNVGFQESKFMASKLTEAGKSVELFLYPKHDHYLNDATVRTEMLSKSDAFLRRTMGM